MWLWFSIRRHCTLSFFCPLYGTPIALKTSVSNILNQNNLFELSHDVDTYIFGHHLLNLMENKSIILSTIAFIKDTGRFLWVFKVVFGCLRPIPRPALRAYNLFLASLYINSMCCVVCLLGLTKILSSQWVYYCFLSVL